MLSKYIVLSSIFSLAYGGLVRRADATTVYNDLVTCDGKIPPINTDLNNLNSPTASGAQVIQLTSDSNALNVCIRQAYNDCQATVASSVTANQAQMIISYCQSPLEPDIKALVANLISKKSRLANVLSTVRQQLKWTQDNTTLLNNCLLSKTPATPTTLRPDATACINKVNSDIASAVAAYA